MGHSLFSKPVFLKLHLTGNFQARSPRDAAKYLERFWPVERTAHYRQAKVLCYAAAETARVALVDAAQRAGVLADRREVDSVIGNTADAVGEVVSPPDVRHYEDEPEVTGSDLMGYYRGSDIIEDPSLSPSRKRALLAYWAPDVHAVAGSPSLRCVRGVTVTINSILDAKCGLDAELDQGAMLTVSVDASRPLVARDALWRSRQSRAAMKGSFSTGSWMSSG